MWKKIILASLVTGCAPVCTFAQENAEAPKVVYRQAEEVFTDDATGLKFESRIGSYNKTSASCNVNPTFGTAVRFKNEVASGDVYIYSLNSKGDPVSADDLKKEFANVVKSITSMPARSKMVKTVVPVENPRLKLPADVLAQSFTIRTDDQTMKTVLLLFLYKGRIIKIRVLSPANDPQEERDAILFCKEILNMTGRK